ncbi:MAG TPA: Sec-independent protein translocase subunit TatA [Actinophytocola sp.]|uniref:Sec-independent protein translocase subunit TatA n=1 Tax=Actinophytocola sp. TaxID=1872138 RepID=UPI002DDCA848|nr:Sec-independent protein translocase subunit TatA [Actinophytocola sp.]HEV2783534.1 Sec-independent protein translocase subunit TatA [Actinophytocola sp.]
MNLGPWEILIIAGVIILLFGARKMPQMARSLGQSMRILKSETKGLRSDEEAEQAKPQSQLPEAKPQTPAPEVAKPIEQQTQANKNPS